MKLSEFQKHALTGETPTPPVSELAMQEPGPSPASATAESISASEAPQEEQSTTTTTPSGVEIQYAWAPRRLYRLRNAMNAATLDCLWREVPSVTTVLGVLDKSGPLTWWGQGVGVEGTLELFGRHLFPPDDPLPSKDRVVELLTEHKLTVNHVKDKAADRGVNVHGALETWVAGQTFATSDFEEHEQGYVRGLGEFVTAVDAVADTRESELMVGSLQHQYAGRFDLVLTLSKPVPVVTRCYPKRPPKIEEIPAGRYLVDLKTRAKASVYPTNYMQLEAYEAAAVECGYEPTDYRAVIVVTPDGKYQFSVNQDYCFDDFLAVRACFQVMNEREVLRVLREELDAEEVA